MILKQKCICENFHFSMGSWMEENELKNIHIAIPGDENRYGGREKIGFINEKKRQLSKPEIYVTSIKIMVSFAGIYFSS